MKLRRLYNALWILLYWQLVTNFLSFFGIFNVVAFLKIADIRIYEIDSEIAEYWISPAQLYEGVLFGLFFGGLFLLVNYISDRFHWDTLGFSKVILLKTLIYVGGFALIIASVFSILNLAGVYSDDLTDEFSLGWEMMIMFGFVIIYLLANLILLNYIIQTNKKIGDFNVISFLTGKYRNPVIEERAFMFLDLKSSTTIAEELGTVKYSRLIRDVFRDLNNVLRKYPLEIYQYVGDEVVITGIWKPDIIPKMVRFYFNFNQRLDDKSAYYQQEYGLIPLFKAGLHGGKVSVTEIGTIRRDIAYHGDVLNTASRIEGLCNTHQQQLMVSSETLSKSPLNGEYIVEPLGELELRGRVERIEVVGVKRITDNG